MATFDPAKLVFLDECGTHLAHTRAYGRAPCGKRAGGQVPRNREKVTTLFACLTPTGLGSTTSREGVTTKATFLAYVRDEVAPLLEPGQVANLDDLEAHRPAEVRALVEARGATLLSLPNYSPDPNPIELAFGTLKAALRRVGARTREAMVAWIAEAVAAIPPEQVRGFYAHCGHPLPAQP